MKNEVIELKSTINDRKNCHLSLFSIRNNRRICAVFICQSKMNHNFETQLIAVKFKQ